MKVTIDINEEDYKIIKRNADLFIYDKDLSFDQLVSRAFHSIKDATTETDYMYKDLYNDLCEYKDLLTKTVNTLSDITHGDFLYGKWLAYSDCLTMINGIINKHELAGAANKVEGDK